MKPDPILRMALLALSAHGMTPPVQGPMPKRRPYTGPARCPRCRRLETEPTDRENEHRCQRQGCGHTFTAS